MLQLLDSSHDPIIAVEIEILKLNSQPYYGSYVNHDKIDKILRSMRNPNAIETTEKYIFLVKWQSRQPGLYDAPQDSFVQESEIFKHQPEILIEYYRMFHH